MLFNRNHPESKSGVTTIASVTGRGLGQLGFADSVTAAMFIVAGIACFSYKAAVMAVVATLLATLVNRLTQLYSASEWEIGLSGYNSAVVGILWGGMLDPERLHLLVYFPLSIALCIFLEYGSRKFLHRYYLPVLTAPAVLTVWITAAVFSLFNLKFWLLGSSANQDETLAIPGIVFILTALVSVSRAAAAQAVILGVIAALVGRWVTGLDMLTLGGLWGFTVVTASFGIQAVFFQGSTSAAIAGVIASVIAAAIWLLWISSPVNEVLPALLVPFIIATWATLLWARKMDLSLLLEPFRTWSFLARRAFL